MTTRGTLTVDQAANILRERRERHSRDPVPRLDAATYLEWARLWRPQTTDDFLARKLYNGKTIHRIAKASGTNGVNRRALRGLIRQLASLLISMRHPPASRRLLAAIARLFPNASRLQNGDFAASCPLHCLLHKDDQQKQQWMTLGLQLSTGLRGEDGELEVRCRAGCDTDELLAQVKRRARAEGIELPGPSTNQGERDQHRAVAAAYRRAAAILQAQGLSESFHAWEMAARAQRRAKAVEISRGRGTEDELQWATRQLCRIYHIVTGRLPGRDFDHYKKRGPSPFEKFAAAAIKPLWPNKVGVGRHIRAAVRWYKSWYKNNRPDA
jgi:hypothetical protein